MTKRKYKLTPEAALRIEAMAYFNRKARPLWNKYRVRSADMWAKLKYKSFRECMTEWSYTGAVMEYWVMAVDEVVMELEARHGRTETEERP